MDSAISRVKEYVREAEIEKVAKTVTVPTQDERVRKYLRFMGEPITYFGEDRGDRRARLRKLMAIRKMENKPVEPPDEAPEELEPAITEEYSIPGSQELLKARHKITENAKQRTSRRLECERERYEVYKNDEKAFIVHELELKTVLATKVAQLAPYGAQSGFQRPVSALRLHPHENTISAADWSGEIALLDKTSLEVLKTSSSPGRVSGMAWNPTGTVLASGDWSGPISLHDNSLEPVGSLQGHTSRVSKLEFHPQLNYLATASYDSTWKLWDSETRVELLSQPGHSRPVHAISFHPDGNLLVSGGLDGIGRVWDLRSGKSVMVLDGHLREIFSTAWCPNGVNVLTSGADNNALVWDIRQVSKIHEIPAHQSIVSDMRVSDGVLVTASYDNTVRFWELYSWSLLRTIGTGEKVLAVDFDGTCLGIGRWDRAIDIYS